MRTKTSIDIHTYWNRLRGLDAGPLRSDIQPGDVRHILPDLFILERNSAGNPVFRLAGTRVCTYFGRELRTWDFSTLWMRDDIDNARHIASTAMLDRKPVQLIANGLNCYHDDVKLEILLLPIRSSGQCFDRLLGSMSLIMPRRWSSNYTLMGLEIEHCSVIGARDAAPSASFPSRQNITPARYGAIEKQVHDLIQNMRRLALRHRDPSV